MSKSPVADMRERKAPATTVMHPTKGLRRINLKRTLAQVMMSNIFHRAAFKARNGEFAPA